MATDTASRASMDHMWNQHGSDGGRDRETRKRNTLEEAARQTAGPRAIAFYGARTPSLVPADTHLNVDFVNDGQGGFKPMTDISEVVEYGEDRVGRLTGVKPKDSNTSWITSVFHLPYSLCQEIPNYYPREDEDGKPLRNEDGTKLNRSRWIVKPGMEDEADRYFEETLKFWATVLPGGMDAIHGGSVNYDESRPHMHVVSDPFEQNQRSKDPEALKMAFSKAFSYHPNSPKVPKTYPGTDTPVPDDDGEPVMIGESAQMKMTRYHKMFKRHMLDAGFDIEKERDAKRHNRRSDLHDYQASQDALAVAEGKTEHWESEVRPELEANAEGYLETYFETVTEPKLRQQVTKEAVADAEVDAAEIKQSATNEAEKIRAAARAQQTRILADARKKAEEEAEKIKTEAEAIKADAKKAAKQEAEKIKTSARSEAAGITETAKSKAAGIKTEAETEADKIKTAAEDNAKKITDEAQEEVKSLKADWITEKQTQLADLQAKADELMEMQEQLPDLIQKQVETVGKTLWKGVNADYRDAAKQVRTRDGRPASEEIEAILEYNRRGMTDSQLRLSALQTVGQRGRALRENLSEHAALAEAEAEAAALEEENENEG